MKLTKIVRDCVSSPRKKLGMIMPELRILRAELEAIRLMQPLDGIVRFFASVSPWYDRLEEIAKIITAFNRANHGGKYNDVIILLEGLFAHLRNAGRHRYGLNRTEKSEAVVAEKIFLGDICGLFTHPIPFWVSVKNEPKGGWSYPNMEHLNAYDVVCNQATDFMRSHDQICLIIGLLNGYVANSVTK